VDFLSARASIQLVSIDVTGRCRLFKASRHRWLRRLEAVYVPEAIGRHILATGVPVHVDLRNWLSKATPTHSIAISLAGQLSHLSHHLLVDHLLLLVSLRTGHCCVGVEVFRVRVHLVLHLDQALHLEVLDALTTHARGTTHHRVDLHPVVGLVLILLLL